MNEEKRVKCPFCSELIFPTVNRCPFCKEWISKYEEFVEKAVLESSDGRKVVEVVEKGGGSGFRLGFAFRVSLALFYVALIVAGVFYEAKAREVLDYAREMKGKKKYEVAYFAYRIMAKKYPLSYAVSDAMIEISRIDVDSLSFDLPEIEVTFLERLSGGRFDSCYHYGLPLVASAVCFAVCFLMLLARIFQSKAVMFASLIVVFSGLFFMIQVTAYGWVGYFGSFSEMSVLIMKSREGVYVVGYVLLFITAIATLRGRKKRMVRM